MSLKSVTDRLTDHGRLVLELFSQLIKILALLLRWRRTEEVCSVRVCPRVLVRQMAGSSSLPGTDSSLERWTFLVSTGQRRRPGEVCYYPSSISRHLDVLVTMSTTIIIIKTSTTSTVLLTPSGQTEGQWMQDLSFPISRGISTALSLFPPSDGEVVVASFNI